MLNLSAYLQQTELRFSVRGSIQVRNRVKSRFDKPEISLLVKGPVETHQID